MSESILKTQPESQSDSIATEVTTSNANSKRFPGWLSAFGFILAITALGFGISSSWLEWGPDLHKEPKSKVTMTVDGEPVDNVAEGIGAALGDVAVGFGKRVKDRILKKDENPDEPQEGLAFTPEQTEPATTDSKSSEKKEYSLTSVLGFISILTGVLAVGIGVSGYTLGGNKALAGFTIVIALIGAFLQAPIILGVALGIVILAGLGGLGWSQ